MPDVNQIGVLLWGVVLGWLIMFAVQRYRVYWGAFATFIAAIAGTGFLGFLYAADLLGYYFIGIFIGFFGNLIVRSVGTAIGGKRGDALLKISVFAGRKG